MIAVDLARSGRCRRATAPADQHANLLGPGVPGAAARDATVRRPGSFRRGKLAAAHLHHRASRASQPRRTQPRLYDYVNHDSTQPFRVMTGDTRAMAGSRSSCRAADARGALSASEELTLEFGRQGAPRHTQGFDPHLRACASSGLVQGHVTRIQRRTARTGRAAAVPRHDGLPYPDGEYLPRRSCAPQYRKGVEPRATWTATEHP